MPITRTPLIDDDGSGTTGTILNNAWQTGLYNAIDAFAANPQATAIRYGPHTTASTFGDNVAVPNGATSPVWFLNPASNQNVTGIVAELDMTEHILVNITGFVITFHQQHASSAAANRLLCPGYANYSLTTWNSIRILYSAALTSWILQKA